MLRMFGPRAHVFGPQNVGPGSNNCATRMQQILNSYDSASFSDYVHNYCILFSYHLHIVYQMTYYLPIVPAYIFHIIFVFLIICINRFFGYLQGVFFYCCNTPLSHPPLDPPLPPGVWLYTHEKNMGTTIITTQNNDNNKRRGKQKLMLKQYVFLKNVKT